MFRNRPLGLTFHGDLVIGAAYSPYVLPDDLCVTNDLCLLYTNISKLPEGLVVRGDLNMSGTEVSELPDDLCVGGQLDITDTEIKTIPPDTRVDGIVMLSLQSRAHRRNKTVVVRNDYAS